MILVLEIVLLIFGLVTLIIGRLTLFPKREVRGALARYLGALLMFPLPFAFLYGYFYAQSLPGRFTGFRVVKVISESDVNHLLAIELIVLGGAIVIVGGIFALASRPAVYRPRTVLPAPSASRCPRCSSEFSLMPELANRRIRCPKCQLALIVNDSATDVTPVALPPQPVAPSPVAPVSSIPRCPGCSSALSLRAEFAGRQVRCSKCQMMLVVAASGNEVNPAAAPPAPASPAPVTNAPRLSQ